MALLFTIYLLILAGALVRVTGSGMGCPDWPKCFDRFVPPTDVNDIRPDYKEYYQAKTGHAIADFNVYHTYIEYINRMIAVVTGLIGIVMFICSLAFRKQNIRIVWFSLLVLFAIGFEGWLGKLVVNTNLKEIMVSLHMLVSLIIVFFLVYMASATQAIKSSAASSLPIIKFGSVAMLLMVAGQILLGTQVRENLDHIASNMSGLDRDTWISQTGVSFLVHRSFSWILIVLATVMMVKAKKELGNGGSTKALNLLMITFVIQMITGFVMNYQAIPEAAQAIHLLIGSISFGLICYINIQQYKRIQSVLVTA
jgi:cytochrome c oxidase assembly protein subunit 15